MPIINIHLTKPEPTKEVQDEIANAITKVMVDKLGKNPSRVVIKFEYDEASDFYFGGVSVEKMRKEK